MSLARTALRLAAVAALEADPVIAGLCPGRIFDSRIDELDSADPVPVIVVFTDDDVGRAWSANNGGPPFDHACDLLLEISMRETVAIPGGQPQEVVLGMSETDSQMEATLDLLEERAIDAVTVADTPQARLIRTSVTRRSTELKSIRYASADTSAKIAMRLATLTTHLKIEQPDLLNPPTGLFATLPDPLRTVALAQPAGSPGYATCLAIANAITRPAEALFKGADVTLAARIDFDPDAPPTPTAPQPPDPILAAIDIPDPS